MSRRQNCWRRLATSEALLRHGHGVVSLPVPPVCQRGSRAGAEWTNSLQLSLSGYVGLLGSVRHVAVEVV